VRPNAPDQKRSWSHNLSQLHLLPSSVSGCWDALAQQKGAGLSLDGFSCVIRQIQSLISVHNLIIMSKQTRLRQGGELSALIRKPVADWLP